MTPEVAEIVAELDAHRARFEVFCRSLSSEELGRAVPKSTWIVRDFIAHLATIDRPVGEMFRTMHAGADPGLRGADGQRFDVDAWNEGQVQSRRQLSVEELLAEADASRAELKQDLAALTAEDLAKTLRFQGDSKRPPSEIALGRYLRGWCKHDPMHVLDMVRALPERETPELAAWFADPVIQGYQAMMNRS